MATPLQTAPFAVPMTNMNLGASEALNQIVDNLNHLNVIMNQAVNTIQFRIKQESSLLSSISQRIDAAYKKTQLIAQNPNKSTTIYSSNNFPAKPSSSSSSTPIIDKTNFKSPIKPTRKDYKLSINQRNEKPSSVDTVSLLNSMNQRTDTDDDAKKYRNKIPDHVTSIADCMVFDTNHNAYNGHDGVHNIYNKTRRRKKVKKKLNDNKQLVDAPESIRNKHYNLKQQQKTYGDSIKYRPDRNKGPKLRVHFNVFNDDNHNGNVATDIKWKDDAINPVFIPSAVINEDIKFEYDDDIAPPSMLKPVKQDKTEKDEKNKKKVHHYPTPKAVEDDNKGSQQPVIPEDYAQNKPLQKEPRKEIVEEKEEKKVVKFENKAKEKEKKKLPKKPLPFDANALSAQKERLKKKPDNESGKKKGNKKNAMQQALEDAMDKLRDAVGNDSEDDNYNSDYSQMSD